jgi:hypothetical protein
MGFNPYRRQRRRPGDVAIVAVALGIVAAMVIWALIG